MATSISQLPSASTAEIVDGAEIIINTTDNETKTTTLGQLRSTFFCETLCTSVTIASADVLTLNSTPVELISAQGAGTVIEIISAFYQFDFNSVSYATNTDLYVRHATTSSLVAIMSGGLAVNDSTPTKMALKSSASLVTKDMPANTKIEAYTPTGNPTARS